MPISVRQTIPDADADAGFESDSDADADADAGFNFGSDADADGGFRQVGLDTYLQHLDGALPQADTRPQVAVVVAEGEGRGG